MADDFASDSDAAKVGGGTERFVVKEDVIMDDIYRASTKGSSVESEDDIEEWKKSLHPTDKLLFMRLPLPLTGAELEKGVEDAIDALDFADPMLRIVQAKIRGIRKYLVVVELEECELLRTFQSEVVQAPSAEVREEQRSEMDRKIAEIRDRRATLRALEYDAIQERARLIDAHTQRNSINWRAHSQADYVADRNGLDWWMAGFMILSVLVVVGYIVFLTFPTYAQPSTRAVLDPSSPFEFGFRLTSLVAFFVVVGMSWWMASLKRFAWGSLSLNLLLLSWAIVFGLLMIVFFRWAFITGFQQIPLTPQLGTLAIYAAAAVLCSHAVLLGRINAQQGMVMATLEVILFAILTSFQAHYKVVDNGGGVSVWIYGGCFGLVASVVYAFCHHKPGKAGHARQPNKRYNVELRDNGVLRTLSYRSSAFAWVGTMLLWVLWPVFNAALAPALGQSRVMATTLTALTASTITATALSHWLHTGFSLRAMLSSTLSGGVAMSCAHSVIVPPYVAFLLGIASGIVSSIGEAWLVNPLETGFKIYDTQGVTWNLLIPATFGFVVAAITTAAASGGVVWGTAYTALFPSTNQAGYLAASWALALAFALVGGGLSGVILYFMREDHAKKQMFREEMFMHGDDYGAF